MEGLEHEVDDDLVVGAIEPLEFVEPLAELDWVEVGRRDVLRRRRLRRLALVACLDGVVGGLDGGSCLRFALGIGFMGLLVLGFGVILEVLVKHASADPFSLVGTVQDADGLLAEDVAALVFAPDHHCLVA